MGPRARRTCPGSNGSVVRATLSLSQGQSCARSQNMSVRLRKWIDKQGHQQKTWMVDVKFEHSDGHIERVRKSSPVQTRRGAARYEWEVRHHLLKGTFGKESVEVPTLAQFRERFLTYAINNNKMSTVENKRQILERHLVPYFGRMKLDKIGPGLIEEFKARKL